MTETTTAGIITEIPTETTIITTADTTEETEIIKYSLSLMIQLFNANNTSFVNFIVFTPSSSGICKLYHII